MNGTELDGVVSSLAAKLAGLDLDEDEKGVLVGLLQPQPEVAGFAYDLNPNDLSVLDQTADFKALIGIRLGQMPEAIPPLLSLLITPLPSVFL